MTAASIPPYRLYRMHPNAADITAGDLTGATMIGTYPDFAAALSARDDDTAALFAQTGPGELLEVRHEIVNSAGSLGVISGMQRSTHPGPRDVEETREWLRDTHRPD